MARKQKSRDTQLNVRIPRELAERLETTAEVLGTNRSNLTRMILCEKLHEYEERARQCRPPARED